MKINNNKVLDQGWKKARLIIRERFLNTLEATAWGLLEKTSVPIITHNLWDSIGCGIYHNGKLLRVVFPKQEAINPSLYEDEWGRENLENMIMDAPSEIKSYSGYVLYYVAAMKYSQEINDRPRIDVLKEDLVKPMFETYIHMV